MPTSNLLTFEGQQTCYDKDGNYLEANYKKGSDNQKITNYGFG